MQASRQRNTHIHKVKISGAEKRQRGPIYGMLWAWVAAEVAGMPVQLQ